MIQSRIVPLGEWLPDQPDLNNGVVDLVNAIPQAGSYRSINTPLAISNALDGRALRAVTAKDDAGTINSFAADGTKLYKISGAAFSNVSQVGNYTATSWEFTKFGKRLIAVSPEHVPQYYDMGVSALFADLPGTPPKAAHIAVVRDFVVMGNLDDGGTQYPSRVQWSGFNNSEIWGVSAGEQADFQDLFGNGGKIQRIVPGEYGVIFQENAIWRMDYAGPPTVFRFDEVERGRGTLAPNSVAWLGHDIYYWGHDGFYAFNGQVSAPIGSEKVDRYVKNRLDTSRMDEFFGGIDRRNNLVMWSYPVAETGSCELIFYNWSTGKWGHSDVCVQTINEFADSGYSLDDLDTLFADIDSASIPVDSTEFLGGSIQLAVFNDANKLATFTGTPRDAEIATGESILNDGKRYYISSMRPIVEGMGTYSIALGKRNYQNVPEAFGTAKEVNAIGEAQFHADVRFPRAKLVMTDGFTHASAVEVFFKQTGRI